MMKSYVIKNKTVNDYFRLVLNCWKV